MAAASRLLLPAAVAALALHAAEACAETATGSLAVRVVVQPSCAVTGGTLDFGTYTSGQAVDLQAATQIGYANCSAASLRFDLSGGANGTTAARRAANGSGGFLNYALFRDLARTLNFGDGTSGQTVTPAAGGTGSITVHGRVPRSQTITPGTYTDIVTITLNF